MTNGKRAVLGTLALASAVWWASWAETKPRPDRPAVIDLDAERAALLRTDREFSERSASKGLTDAFLAYMAEGATMLPPNTGPVVGREAVKELLGDGGGVLLTWTPIKADVAASGDLGYTWGTSEWRVPGPNGPTLARTGKYVSVWKKQSDGAWKWVVDCGNSVAMPPPDAKPPAPAPPAPASPSSHP
jgi:ketosteroid isomerase-like protein